MLSGKKKKKVGQVCQHHKGLGFCPKASACFQRAGNMEGAPSITTE